MAIKAFPQVLFLKAEQTQLSQPLLTSQPFLILGSPLQPFSGLSLPVLILFMSQAQHWAQHSRYGPTSAELSGMMAPLSLLLMPLLMAPSTLQCPFAAAMHCPLVLSSNAVTNQTLPCALPPVKPSKRL